MEFLPFSLFSVICASILILSLVIEGQAQEISDKIDFETYNAQLLNNIEESPTQNVDDRLTSSSQEEIIGQSVISTTSSAISYDEENLHVDDFTSSSSFKDQPAPRPRSDRTSQNSWSLNEDVPLNDPELGAVFPQFAEAYNQEEAQQQVKNHAFKSSIWESCAISRNVQGRYHIRFRAGISA